jgi:hypothetical protein
VRQYYIAILVIYFLYCHTTSNTVLFITEEESLESNNIDKYAVTLDEIERWRQCGALGKLYNFVVYI